MRRPPVLLEVRPTSLRQHQRYRSLHSFSTFAFAVIWQVALSATLAGRAFTVHYRNSTLPGGNPTSAPACIEVRWSFTSLSPFASVSDANTPPGSTVCSWLDCSISQVLPLGVRSYVLADVRSKIPTILASTMFSGIELCNGPPVSAIRLFAEVDVTDAVSIDVSAGQQTVLTSVGLPLEPAPAAAVAGTGAGNKSVSSIWRPFVAPSAAIAAADGLFSVLAPNGTLLQFGSDPLSLSQGHWPPARAPVSDQDGLSTAFVLRSGRLGVFGAPRPGSTFVALPTQDLVIFNTSEPVQEADVSLGDNIAILTRTSGSLLLGSASALFTAPGLPAGFAVVRAAAFGTIQPSGGICRGPTNDVVYITRSRQVGRAGVGMPAYTAGPTYMSPQPAMTMVACSRTVGTLCSADTVGRVFCYGDGMDATYASSSYELRHIPELPAGVAVLKLDSWTGGYMCALLAGGAGGTAVQYAADGSLVGDVYCWGYRMVAQTPPSPRRMFGITGAADIACVLERCTVLLANGTMVSFGKTGMTPVPDPAGIGPSVVAAVGVRNVKLSCNRFHCCLASPLGLHCSGSGLGLLLRADGIGAPFAAQLDAPVMAAAAGVTAVSGFRLVQASALDVRSASALMLRDGRLLGRGFGPANQLPATAASNAFTPFVPPGSAVPSDGSQP